MKKPSGKRPALFMQWAETKPNKRNHDADYWTSSAQRIRIVYPKGNIEWCSLATSVDPYGVFIWSVRPCYLINLKDALMPKTFREAMRLIDAFDDASGYKPMEFICEL